MPFGPALAATATIGGAIISANASKSAANTEANAANNATALNKYEYDNNISLQQPFHDAGVSALGTIQAGLQPGGQFDPSTFNYQADPGYAFRLSQGTKALDASASARGLSLSGGQLQALQSYGQDLGSQEYQASYQRNISDSFNRLASVAGIGQTATQSDVASGNTLAANNSELGLQGANAQAAGTLGTASAINNGITQLGKWWQNYNTANPSSTVTGYDTVPGATASANYGGVTYNSDPYTFGGQ